MDHQHFIDAVALPCAILAVGKEAGEVRIVCSNARFKELVGGACEDNIPYDRVLPQNLKFEQFCMRAANDGQRGHVYVKNEKLGVWADQQIIPMESEEEDFGYCQYLVELSHTADFRRMAEISMDAAETAIRASVILMSAEDFREGVQEVMRDTLAISGAHNSRLFLLDHKNKSLKIFAEAYGPQGIRRHNDALTYDLVKTWGDTIGNGNFLLLVSERDMAALERLNPAWAANLRQFGVKSLVLLPLRRGKEIFGYVDYVNFDVRKVIEVKELAELVSIYLGAEISNHLLMEQLRELSTTDALTGLKNRGAMLRRMEMIGDGESFGVINFDLNGLKRVNDTLGHDAGDRFLTMAAEALKKVFYYNDIYRTGGDEFIVLTPGISRESFERKLERFRTAMGKNEELSFAMGAFWSDGSVDLPAAFRRADAAMYRDKQNYYRLHPELRRTHAAEDLF